MGPFWTLRILTAMSVVVWTLIIAAALTSVLALVAAGAVLWTLIRKKGKDS